MKKKIKKFIIYGLITNQLVALFVTVLLTYKRGFKCFGGYFLISAIISNFIGFSIFFLHLFLLRPLEERIGKLARFVLIFSGIVFGTEASILFMNLVFENPPIPLKSKAHLLTAALNFVVGLAVSIVVSSYFLLKRELEAKALENEKLRRLHAEVELKALQARIKPHFLFNTLNSILSLIRTEPSLAERAIISLSEILRKSMELPQKIPVEDELCLVENYLEIEKIRLGKRLSYEIELQKDMKGFEIPPFTIQPLVENSIAHCISRRKEGGKIKIRIWREGQWAMVCVFNSGCEAEIKPGFGLLNLKERLNLLYEDAQMRFAKRGGTEVLLKIRIGGKK